MEGRKEKRNPIDNGITLFFVQKGHHYPEIKDKIKTTKPVKPKDKQ
jgi:hypothetical protein